MDLVQEIAIKEAHSRSAHQVSAKRRYLVQRSAPYATNRRSLHQVPCRKYHILQTNQVPCKKRIFPQKHGFPQEQPSPSTAFPGKRHIPQKAPHSKKVSHSTSTAFPRKHCSFSSTPTEKPAHEGRLFCYEDEDGLVFLCLCSSVLCEELSLNISRDWLVVRELHCEGC